jgi:hypothetical protein
MHGPRIITLLRNYPQFSTLAGSRGVTNCYEAAAVDEMRCHPGLDHTFSVFEGPLHLPEAEATEELTLKRDKCGQSKIA